MNKRIGLKAAIATAGLVLAAATPALAVTVDAGGGRWSYDQGANTAWSNFLHAKQTHASSVMIGSQLTRSGCTDKGVWSLASGAKNGGSISYYYDPLC
ncbi:lactococcin 972 family bacteriocin [Streptomyces sp. NPDC053741]|uniref:lactococcin 972 family bacteriocin n=1 Tax=Streptomyces TaxID=1883 RepID=UPI002E35F05F|nr:lactococcin 972 family bacteriocin [[Kitasatospora] papulosa]WSZ50810.1 lactococcin 972 family bacteriocin [[Kitasatospora] papulosa]